MKQGVAVLSVFLLGLSLLVCPAMAQDGNDDDSEDDDEKQKERYICSLLLLIGGFSFLGFIWYLQKHKIKKVARVLASLVKFEPKWNRDELLEYVERTFMDIKTAWYERDRDRLQELVAEELYGQWSLVLDRMEELGQLNVLENLKVKKIDIVDVKDYTDDERDRFTAEITASAADYTVNEEGEWTYPRWSEDAHENLQMDEGPFTELWTFVSHEGEWKLRKVEQYGAEMKYLVHGPVLEDEKHAGPGKK